MKDLLRIYSARYRLGKYISEFPHKNMMEPTTFSSREPSPSPEEPDDRLHISLNPGKNLILIHLTVDIQLYGNQSQIPLAMLTDIISICLFEIFFQQPHDYLVVISSILEDGLTQNPFLFVTTFFM